MIRDELKLLLVTLKKVLKTKKIRYPAVAAHLETSEITVKRLFAGQGCTIEKIIAICELCGISFFDLTQMAAKPSEETYFLTRNQEEHFVLYPGQYSIFKDLVRRRDPETIRSEWNISEKKFYSILRQFEKLKLLEVMPGNKANLLVRGSLRIDDDGPLARALVLDQNIKFLEHVQNNVRDKEVCYQTIECLLTPTQVKSLVSEIHALGRKYRLESQTTSKLYKPEDTQSVRWLFAFSDYRTDWKQYRI